MKKAIAAIILIVIACLASCGSPEIHGEKIEVTITDDGIGITGTDVAIYNYYKGARAEVEYLIENDSSADVEPEIYVRFKVEPGNYSRGKDYEPVPTYYYDWLEIPRCGVIEAHAAKSYLIVLEIPEDVDEEIPDKWAFKIGVKPQSGAVQNTVATWWRINMR